MTLEGVELSGGRAGALPLAGSPLFVSTDVDEARVRVAEVYCDHRLDPMGRGRFAARHNRLSGRDLSVNVMTYTAKTMITPGALREFYLFQYPLTGHASISNGANRHEIGGGRSGVVNPDEDTCMIWGEGCAQLMIQVRREALQRMARSHFGLPEGQTLRFFGANDMRAGEGKAFLGLLNYAVSGEGLLGKGGLMGQQLETMLMVGLLQTQRHNRSDHVQEVGGPLPRAVRLAEDYMKAHLTETITLEGLAREVGVSERALQAAFRAGRGRSPMTVLRDLRLERAWQDLSHPGPGTSVTDVAMQLGFFHLGRFSEHYRRKFGCTPSETLRGAGRL
jgi:AraC-type DNA-binding domain-containing proteins